MLRWWLLALIGLSFCCSGPQGGCVDSRDPCSPRAQCAYTGNGWRACVCCTLGPDAGWAVDIGTPACVAESTFWKEHCPNG